MKVWLLGAGLIWGSGCPMYGRQSGDPTNVRFDVISSLQGLSQSTVFSLAQDNKGYIWIGTRDGLNRYDGYSFVTYRINPLDTNSLSNNEITVIHADRFGDLWIGTRGGGLNKFVSRTNTFIRYPELTQEKIVRDIFESPDGTLWIGSSDGLLKAQISRENTKGHFDNVTKNSIYRDEYGKILSRQKEMISVVSICQPATDTFLIGTEDGAFYYFPRKGLFQRFKTDPISPTIVTSMEIGADKTVWMGTFEGLVRAEPIKNAPGKYTISWYNIRQPFPRKINANRIETLAKDQNGNIWAGTRGGGLLKIDRDGTVISYLNDQNDITSLRDNIVNSLLVDNTGVLWIGTESQGCNTLDLNSQKFMHIRSIPNNPNSLGGALVTAITGKGNEVVWAGSAVKGFDKIQLDDHGNYTIRHFPDIPAGSEITNEVISLFLDSDDNLWIGNATNSLVCYHERRGFSSYTVGGFVFSFHEDKQGRLWYGTWGQGLGWIDKKNSTFHKILPSSVASRTLSSDKVIALSEDKQGNLWIGTKGGGVNILPLYMGNQVSSDFITYKHDNGDPKSLSHNDVYCIHQDNQGIIWVGTGSGLNKVTWNENQSLTDAVLKGEIAFKGYLEKDGLSNGVVYGILEDRQGMLWLSTNKGLSKFDPSREKFINYFVNDGLQANEFYANAYYQNDDGQMFFGGVNGLSVFNPDSIRQNPVYSNVILTGLKIFSKYVRPGEKINNRKILDEDIAYTKKLKLLYKEKEITFEFSAMHYANPQRIHYQYRLIGFNDEWQQVDRNARTATYTNLDEGNYVFQVRVVNNDGITAGVPTELEISILPPFWRRPWFFVFYILIIIGSLILFRSYSLIAVKEKNKMLIERLEHKKLVEMTDAKMRFLTNISHEIRTPLTLICDPLDTVLAEGSMDENSKKHLKLISKNVHRLLGLANQLLQLRKIDLGVLQPKLVSTRLVPFLKDIMVYFEQYASRRNINLNFNSEIDDVTLRFDPELMTTVFYNLLANSFKYTADEGTISVRIYRHQGFVQKRIFNYLKLRFRAQSLRQNWIAVEITDTGRGMPEKELLNIFRRFYQINESVVNHNSGSGIGLSLVKEYVELHKGHIEVQSVPNEGSVFTVYLPDEDHLADEKRKISQQKEQPPVNTVPQKLAAFTEEEAPGTIPESQDTGQKASGPGILIIEDDHEMADYLVDYLSKKYQVSVAYNGAKGLKIARDQMPDLIISDVVLPEMNGLQLCESIKKDIETCHIPVILITARASEENVSDGYQHGADLYITKPFAMKLLDTQISMLIESRTKLRDRYSKQILLKPSDVTITPLDEKFLKQLLKVTEMHLADSEFGVSLLIESMHMSHTTILRKVKALTGLSLVEFIKNHRMKKAALILQKDKLPISEVSYMVGFTDPKYFTKCFTREFGKTPTEYAAEYRNVNG